MTKIMIIEDDPKIAGYLEDYILKYNYHVKKVEAFDQIMETFHAYKPHLVLLDINLPYYDGFYWCRQIRKKSIDRKSTRLNSSHVAISYAVFCFKKKKY